MIKEDLREDLSEEVFSYLVNKADELGISLRVNKEDFKIYGKATEEGNFNLINLDIKVEVDLYSSSEEFKILEFSDYDSEFYDGEILAVDTLNEHLNLKDKYKYNGSQVEINTSLEDFKQSHINTKSYNLDEFIEEQKRSAILLTKNKLEQSTEPNLINSTIVREKFAELGRQQRDLPEITMLQCQRKISGGVMSYLLEHIGDLTHRMSEGVFSKNGEIEGTIEFVKPKVTRCLSAMKNKYGIGREHNDNLESNYKYGNYDITFEEWKDEIKEVMNKYSEEHSKLTVYNPVQYAAREAAVELGKENYEKVVEHLEYLNDVIKNGVYIEKASEYTEGGYKPKNKEKRKNSFKR